ncbi:MAG: ABC transporter ATP-binding protein [Candidatus Odyssella sp.]|nr:ABC transporter ATP-binding protein [Candidatus Odyssella sp.]
MPALLEVEDLHAYYGESHVLQGISLAVPKGEVVALMGRNGAGKTTTMRAIVGLVTPRRGAVRFAGRPLAGLRTYEIAQGGVALVPETRGIFPSLTVLENLTVAARGAGPWTLRRVFETFPRLEQRRKNLGGQLSGGEQQMLSIARALMTHPELLMLDEPGEGLAPIIVQDIHRILANLKDEGVTMLLVEKSFAFATSLADTVYVIGKGQVRWQGPAEGLKAAEDVKSTWLGV